MLCSTQKLTKSLDCPKLLAVLIIMGGGAFSLRLQSFASATLGKLKAQLLFPRIVLNGSRPGNIEVTFGISDAPSDGPKLVLRLRMLNRLSAFCNSPDKLSRLPGLSQLSDTS